MNVLLLCLVAVAAVSAENKDCEVKCASCPTIQRSECLAGVQKDSECQCCDVCSRYEGQKCDLKNAPHKFGECGDGLECKQISGGNNICQCVWNEIVCGTNGVTYNNLCQLMAAAVSQGLQETLEVKAMGPCDTGAQIVTKPQYIKNYTMENVVLTCEAIGFPVPSIRWKVTRANGKTFDMPADDDHIVIASRGGPGKYQVTGWLQIERLLKRHEGDYDCIATNEGREDHSKARVKVINKGEE